MSTPEAWDEPYYPPLDQPPPFPPTGGAFADGPPAERVRVAGQLLGGLTIAQLTHLTGLSWDELYPIVDSGLERRQFRAEQQPGRMSQGERVAGSVRYAPR